ncbi:Na+/H+ antiporter subunit A [Nanchangia anserum]|uniref:Na+/H+ antiporter subunit A n=1 Tax=Nanchangia anserum TaxID=2692125 RepID=A0A8I0GBT5_9ACTO|nr:Na+/H+ antiporter subunit A [Nanchangia anserum]MBD3689275.1 Na+/H+ antiporter subunit A [Nanchangia anserum]QOX81494.1 Na+/H+ antiporter subunit A [Nanchangia anserum]
MLGIAFAYVCGVGAAPWIMRRWGVRGFAILALIPAAVACWTAAQAPAVWRAPLRTEVGWVSDLSVGLSLRLDQLSWLLLMVISTVGALILVYATRYFPARAPGLRRFATVFMAFAGAMSGVVLVDHTIWLYIMWEGTSLFSFLLIGHHYGRGYARAAARQALLVTTTGSLAMFAGFVTLGEMRGGSYRISVLVEALAAGHLQEGPALTCALLAVCAGAVTKSALVPTHFWLPQAMAAPTPVSAFLHAAAMVKAGVYLVIRFAPGAAHQPGFTAVLTVCGLGALVIGGYRALRQYDLKLILAYGTISQLGLMIALAAQGTADMIAAAMTLLLAHATFKSALFLTTGTIEKIAGTRDLRELSGVRLGARRLATIAVCAAASMAGLPPTLGYLGKEAGLSGALSRGAQGWVFTAVVVAGSVLTVAYTLRYLWAAFAVKGKLRGSLDTRRYTRLERVPTPTWVVPGILAGLSVLGGLLPTGVSALVTPWAETAPGHAHIGWWSGWLPALLTAAIVLAGWLMYRRRPQIARLQRRAAFPTALSARSIYERSLALLEQGAGRVTAMFQRGSLPWETTGILITTLVVVSAAAAYSGTTAQASWVGANSLIEAAVCLLVICSALACVSAPRRLHAVLALGATGAGIGVLFLTFGAPDLGLTQIVVEAVTIVVFVLVLRRLPGTFPGRGDLAHHRRTRALRGIVALLIGVGVVSVGLLAGGGRIDDPVSALLPGEAVEFGYGHNIVNVILVDVRAWDTMGELSVVLVMAIGVASLVYVKELRARNHARGRTHRRRNRQAARAKSREQDSQMLLSASVLLPPQARSVVLEMTVRILFHTLLIVSAWLLVIGHNMPGGGFVSGGVAGIALIVRYLAGGRAELLEAVPFNPGRLLGSGLFVAAIGGLWPLTSGRTVFQTVPLDLDFGWAGSLHLTSALVFDIGVYIVVLGLVLDIIAALGGHVDAIGEREGDQRVEVDFSQPLAPTKEGTS